MKTYKVYTKKVANLLCRQGFRVVGTDINNQKPWLNVFLFEDTSELRAAISSIVKQKSQEE